MDALVAEASDDVRVLARLWQLQNKMQSVGTAGSYGAHLCCQHLMSSSPFKYGDLHSARVTLREAYVTRQGVCERERGYL